jgi:dTDP-4-amino-4,6-dideoxygalactose transaminase
MTSSRSVSYRYRLVAPDLPAPEEYLHLLQEIYQSGWYSNFGPLARRLESGLLAALGLPEEICVTSCSATAGLSAALLATGRGGRVLLSAFTFPASLGAIRAAGMTPVIVDVDANRWTLNRDLLDQALAETGASIVMLVAPFGIRNSFEIELEICRQRGVAVVIDNAAGLGAPRAPDGLGEHVFEVFSMHATKPFAVGEGGIVFAHHRNETSLRAALNFALAAYATVDGPGWGFNGKMDEFHAAIGLVQLHRFRDMIRQRQAFVAMYRDRLKSYPAVVFPQDLSLAPWQVFPILLPSCAAAEHFISVAAAAALEIRRYYRPSLSRWRDTTCWRTCPIAEDLADRMCVLPVRNTSGAETDRIVNLVIETLDRVLAGH